MTSFLSSWHLHHFLNKIIWKCVFDVIGIMVYFLLHDNLLTSWQTFLHHEMFLTLWRTFCRHGKLFDVMMCLTSWRIFRIFANILTSYFDVLTCFWRHKELFEVMTCFWLHYKICFYIFLTPWRVFDVMTCFWLHDKLLDIMTNVWTSWRFWRTFWSNDDLFDIMTYVAIIDVMTNVLTPWNFITTWHTFWLTGALFVALELYNDMTHFLTSWFTFWRHDYLFDVMVFVLLYDKVLSSWRIFVINSGTKYNENVISIL